LLAVLAALAACHKAPAEAEAASASGPALTPGLWQQTVTDTRGAQITRLCLDKAAGRALAGFNGQLGKACTRSEMTQGADGGWRFASTCDMGPLGTVTSHGVVQGDFSSRYTIETDVVRSGGSASPAGASHISAELRRLGDCPSDMKPGDVILPGNIRTHLDETGAPA
jgi:uncharacterized protein DUF3617